MPSQRDILAYSSAAHTLHLLHLRRCLVTYLASFVTLVVSNQVGPVVDVQLKSSVEDSAYSSPVRVAQSIRAGHVTVEVQHLLGGGIFRSVAMQGTQGLRRGDPAELLPGPRTGLTAVGTLWVTEFKALVFATLAAG